MDRPLRPRGTQRSLTRSHRRNAALERRYVDIDQLTGATGPGLFDTLIALGVDGLWKLDEASGTVAHDSSGGGHDMAVSGAHTAPAWGQPALQPGTLCALFAKGSNTQVSTSAFASGFTGDFSAGIWFKRPDDLEQVVIGKGSPLNRSIGWELGIGAVNNLDAPNKACLVVSDGSTIFTVAGNNALDTTGETSYLLGVSRISGVWHLILDGLEQAATSALCPAIEAGVEFIGRSVSTPGDGCDGDASWGFFFGSRALSGSEWLNIQAALTPILPAGQVLTTTGDGGAAFESPTYTVYINGA